MTDAVKYTADKPVNLFIDATFKLTKTLLVALVFSNWSYVPMDSNVWRRLQSSKRSQCNCVRIFLLPIHQFLVPAGSI